MTLTDDILYGDTGGETTNSAGTATATYCDVQGGIDGSDAANHMLNADPKFVSAVRSAPSGRLALLPGGHSLPRPRPRRRPLR